MSQGTQPLYVIDGVQIKPADPQGGAAGSYNAPASYTSPLAGLNPDDIETINVLQGPSATSIFGAPAGTVGRIINPKHRKPRGSKNNLNTFSPPPPLPQI